MAGNDVEINVKIKADRSGFDTVRRTAEAEGRSAGAAYGRGLSGGLPDPRLLALLFTDLTGVLGVIPGAAGAAAAVLGTLGLAVSGVADALNAQGGVAAGMAQSGAAAAAMARQIRDAVDSVNDAREDAARVAEDAARRIEDAERNTARVAEDGARAIADAKARVSEAAQDTADAVADANERLADTEEAVARQIASAEKALADARKQGARTVERTARAGADAVARAADRVAKALAREQEAQEDLSQARQDAARDLEDLQAKVAGYGADEQAAQARVARAALELKKVNASRRYGDIDRQEAAAELAQAEQHLADVQREGKQDAADLAKIQTQGLDATKRVQDAAERVADAHAAVVDATQDRARAEKDAAEANSEAATSSAERIADASERVAQAREDGARRIQDAEEAVAKAAESGAKRQAAAKAALARAEESASQANADAARAEADARREAAESIADAAERVADAEQRLADVQAEQREQAQQAAAATNTYAAALAQLSPNARAFVEAIRELRPEWDALTRSVQDRVFAGLAADVTALAEVYFPVLQQRLGLIGAALNTMARYAAAALMRPEVVQAVNDVLRYTAEFLTAAAPALGNFIAGFLQLMAIGASYLPAFGQWLADITKRFNDWINTKQGRDEIKAWIDRAFVAFGQLWSILSNVFSIVMSVAKGLGIGGGQGLLQALVAVTGALATLAASQGAQQVLNAIGATAMWLVGILKTVGPTAASVANTMTSAFHSAWNFLTGFVNWCGRVFGGVFNGMAAGAKAAVNGTIRVLNGLIDAANWAIRAVNTVTGTSFTQFGHFPYLAKGGIAGGMAVVGENGPELVKLPQGSQVYPSGQSRGMAERLGGAESAGPARVELVFGGNTDGALASAFMKLVNNGQIQIRQSKLVAG